MEAVLHGIELGSLPILPQRPLQVLPAQFSEVAELALWTPVAPHLMDAKMPHEDVDGLVFVPSSLWVLSNSHVTVRAEVHAKNDRLLASMALEVFWWGEPLVSPLPEAGLPALDPPRPASFLPQFWD